MKIIVYFSILIMTILLTVIITKGLITLLKRKKYGQKILEDGPKWHKEKEGTPTMGGISFIVVISLVMFFCLFILKDKSSHKEFVLYLNVMFFAITNGLIGAIDDLAKIKKLQNKGLSAKTKFLLLSVSLADFLFCLKKFIGIETIIKIPFVKEVIDIGPIFYLLSYFLLCGVINSVNLSDGIDGLAICLMLTVGAFISAVAFFLFESMYMTVFSALVVGGCIGFLILNRHPAKIFMGDTGSLFLGAIVVSISFLINNLLLVLLFGFVFIIEAVSDILQVIYLK